MNKNRKLTTLAGIVVLGALLAGCGNAGTTASGGEINVVHVDLGGGHTVTCVSVHDASVDCDWQGAR